MFTIKMDNNQLSFVGLLALVPLRKIMVVDYKLPYPSGTATAVLINGFHTTKGDKMAKKQVQGFMKFFSMSFVWSFFQWFYSGGENCGFINFPTLGLKAWKQTNDLLPPGELVIARGRINAFLGRHVATNQ